MLVFSLSHYKSLTMFLPDGLGFKMWHYHRMKFVQKPLGIVIGENNDILHRHIGCALPKIAKRLQSQSQDCPSCRLEKNIVK